MYCDISTKKLQEETQGVKYHLWVEQNSSDCIRLFSNTFHIPLQVFTSVNLPLLHLYSYSTVPSSLCVSFILVRPLEGAVSRWADVRASGGSANVDHN